MGFCPKNDWCFKVTPLVIKDDQLGNVRWRSNFGFVVGALLIPHWWSAVFGESIESMSYFRKMPSLSQNQVSAPMCTLDFSISNLWLSCKKLGIWINHRNFHGISIVNHVFPCVNYWAIDNPWMILQEMLSMWEILNSYGKPAYIPVKWINDTLNHHLLGGLEHVVFRIFGEESSQVTNSYFSEG